jgi:aryl-alcohol dehydrogenase-like predicted oxidoreductase
MSSCRTRFEPVTTTETFHGREAVVLGAMYFGTRLDETASFALLDRFVDGGGVWIDTANAYAFWVDPGGLGGQSEAVIGRWLAARPGMRDRVRISTKVRWQPTVAHGGMESAEGLSAAAIRAAVDGSRKRLGTDVVDLYWAHGEDAAVPLAETVVAMGELAARGVVRRLGAANHAAWRVERARSLARDHGVPGWTALQLRYSYAQPRPGAVLPDSGHMLASPEQLEYVAADPRLVLWSYTPLVNGAYTRADKPFPDAYDHPGTTRRLAAANDVAAEVGVDAGQVVLAWLLGGTPRVMPIVGVSRPQHVDDALAAADVQLPDDARARLDDPALR